MTVDVPKKLLTQAGGADFANRAHFVEVPSTGKKTATTVPMTTTATSAVLAPKVSSRVMLLAATGGATSSSGTGSFAATPLKASSSWDVSAQTGDFSWQYPLAAPPAAAGPAPSLALNYDSQSVDGETGSTNNQPSAVGDGWELSGGGFIERQYVSCSQDDGSSGAVATSGDLCWKVDNATLSLGGHSSPIVRDKTTGDWKLLADDGSRIEHLVGTAQGCQANGTYDTDCWRVTTGDGTQYYFGLNHLPGWATGNATTNSAWTVPVFGNDAGEPCHASTFASSSCVQAWRWNLDYVVDVHKNAEALYYNAETNSYGKNGTGATSYVRGGQLNHIDYGLTASNVYVANAASDRVTFGYDAYGRCNDTTHAKCTKETVSGAATAPATATAYPDVPFDQLCASTCTANPVPTFWTDAMLSTVTTAARTASTTYTTVDSWTLSHSFPAPGDGTNAALWLTQVQHTGSAGQTAITEPATKFTGMTMQNRVWAVDGLAPLDKWRISSILDTTGSVTSVNYSGQDCQPSEVAAIEAGAATNARRCFPQWWTPQITPAVAPKMDLFHKYVVTSVVADPKTGGGADRPQVTSYVYTGTPAWRYNTSPFTPEKNRTWSVYAGYNTVEVREGDSSKPTAQETTDYVFYQGMDGDRAAASGGSKSVTVTGTDSVTDSAWLAGTTRETKTRNGVGGTVIDDVVNTPWASAATASDGTNTARMLGDGASVDTQPTSGGTRTKRTTTTHDDDGNPATVSTVTSDAGSTCQSTDYAPDNTTAWIRGLPQEQRTVSVACGDDPSLPDDAVSDVRTSYDGNLFGATPSKGDATSTQEVDKYDGTTPHWVTSASSTYDALGRVTGNTDALGRTTATAYTPATSGPLTKTVTTNPAPFKWTSTTTIDPTRGSVLSETATDGSVTTATYDGLGRLANVWLPQRPQASNTTSPSIAYAYAETQSAPLSVATTTVMAHTTATTYQLYDGLGRPVQTQSSSPSTGTVITDTQYDPAGNVSLTNNPYWTVSVSPSGKLFVPESQQQIGSSTQNVYDGAGRQTATITNSFGDERFRTTTAYNGVDETDITPPSGGIPTSTWTNTLGQKTKLAQYLASTPSSSAVKQATVYGYDNRGNMTSTVDPAGNRWSWTYDLLGNKVKSIDPDTGTTTSTFDLAGRQLTTTDARGQTLAYVYDALDRKTAEYADAATTGPLLDSWTWDTVKKGQLTSSSSYTGSIAGTPGNAYTHTVTGYDAGNQPLGITTGLPASTPGFGAYSYNVTYTYNQDESLNNESHPAVGGLAAERIGYAYDGIGNMTSVTGTAAYASAIYTSLGQLAQINRGGNLTNSSAYGYDAATGAVTDIKDISGTGSATAVQADRTYTRNNAGTITSAAVTGVAGAETQCYSYDQLQEITEAWTPNSSSCATAPSKTALGGPAPYWNSYTYDTTTGNRTTATQHGVGAANDTASTYSYPAAGSANPHGVESVDNDGGSGTADAYGYDAAGDTTAMPGQVLTYDADGRIATITKDDKTQSDVYDADGTLLVQNDPDAGTTLFLGSTEVHKTADGTVTATRTYTLDGTAVDERTTEGGSNKDFSLDTDIAGTADLEVGASDQSVARRWVDPFGNQRGTAQSWSSSHGFLNKSESALTGLAQLGARAYDATLGRFLSVDPIFAPENPQQDNGYSYSANNPITNSDPSGACYQAGSDSIDFHTNCSTGPGHKATHGNNSAPGTSGDSKSYHAPAAGWAAKPKPTPAHSGGGCSYDGGTFYCPPSAAARWAAPQTTQSAAETKAEQRQEIVDEALWNHTMATSHAWPWIRATAEWEHNHQGALEGTASLYGGIYGLRSPEGSLGSTGRIAAGNLKEQLALQQVKSNPMAGKMLRTPMTDPRWLGVRGWDKYRQNVNGIEIHYVVNRFTGDVDDFKFKLPTVDPEH